MKTNQRTQFNFGNYGGMVEMFLTGDKVSSIKGHLLVNIGYEAECKEIQVKCGGLQAWGDQSRQAYDLFRLKNMQTGCSGVNACENMCLQDWGTFKGHIVCLGEGQ